MKLIDCNKEYIISGHILTQLIAMKEYALKNNIPALCEVLGELVNHVCETDLKEI